MYVFEIGANLPTCLPATTRTHLLHKNLSLQYCRPNGGWYRFSDLKFTGVMSFRITHVFGYFIIRLLSDGDCFEKTTILYITNE